MPQKLIDETGHRYGALTVLEKTKNNQGRTAWLCQCDCGNLRTVRGSDLRAGKITTCGKAGCKEKIKRNGAFIDETGKQYGRLTVIKRAPYNSESGDVLWICECNCKKHSQVVVLGDSLRSGRTKSCECLHSEQLSQRVQLNLLGQRFGKLLVIEKTKEKDNHGNCYWKCKCDCGNEIVVTATSLNTGNTQSCGCLCSSNELKIIKILQTNQIQYKNQFSFLDLQSPYSSKKFRFDFAILNNDKLLGLIEYHGKQHYQPVAFFGGNETFILRQEYDKIKEDYCKNHQIPLLVLNKENKDLEKEIIQFYERIQKNNGKI